MKNNPRRYAANLALVGAASLAGFITVAIILVALFGGLWLDNYFATESHLWLMVLLCVSVPLTLVAMLWVVRFTTSRIQPAETPKKDEEDAASG